MKKDALLKTFTEQQLLKNPGKLDKMNQAVNLQPINSGMLCKVKGGNGNTNDGPRAVRTN